ncbi:MAG: NAD-dependent dihydropyrimidine dehydrogenase subunit PreA [Candidatus Eisenbacteria bacterium]|nr:NAD-dependent dihydropyrimidine dehydrogenase subunit PreA [Candidatus Eisenbacteria bacterium]
MADLSIDFAGIKSPNPFWLASGPPTNTGAQVARAFDMGWGGAVWKTIGEPVVNVSSRLGGLDGAGQRMVGLTNIELISDRPAEANFRDIEDVKKRFPDRALIASLMFGSKDEWRSAVKRAEDAGADGLELNFGCPHGMCERGMGSAVGQEPEVLRHITSWVKEVANVPVLVKLTPNITDILEPAVAAVEAGADGLVLINTVRSLVGVDLDRLVPVPDVAGRGSPGGYSGPAVKPIALRMVSDLARDERITVPISGLGGVTTWQDAAEFISLGATSVQVCTSVMHYGYRIVEDMVDGMNNYLDEKGMSFVRELVGAAAGRVTEWRELNLSYKVRADIDPDKCIGCQVCYVSCRDGGHCAIHLPGELLAQGHAAPRYRPAARAGGSSDSSSGLQGSPMPGPAEPGLTGWGSTVAGPTGSRVPWVDQTECVGCNLCSLVCPVPGCVRMLEVG